MDIVKGMIGGIQKFSTADGPGIRTTVFLKGCPLNCMWCHNPELINGKNQLMYTKKKCIGCGSCVNICKNHAISLDMEGVHIDSFKCENCYHCADSCYSEALRKAGKISSVEEVMEEVEKDKGYYDRTGGGMTISGGELLTQYKFANALLDYAIEKNIGVALDTSGFGNGDNLYRMAQKAEYILYDMKCIDDELHKKVTGVSNKIILENLIRLASDPSIRKKIKMRMPLIHGINDTPEVINDTFEFYKANKIEDVTLLAYHELGISKYKSLYGIAGKTFTPPTEERLHEIKCLFQSGGIQTIIMGEKIQ